MELSSPMLKELLYFFSKNFLIFQEGTFKARKTKKSTLKKFLIFFQKKFFSNFGMTADQAAK